MDRTSATRQVALLVVAFAATLGLLAGGWALLGRAGSRPHPSALASSAPSAVAIASPSASGSAPSVTVPPAASPNDPDAPTVTLLGAGDIGNCASDGAKQTSDLLVGQPGWIFTAGDNAYEDGSAARFRDCYAPTWGRLLDRTILPTPGNHDWLTPGAAGYRDYFGSRAAPDGTTWYATTIGTWHVIVLDSDCDQVGGCGPDSPEGRWLAADLAANADARCTLAIWHHPRFSSGEHGDDPAVGPFWDQLAAAHADLVVNGHDHDYERFAPQDPSGRAQPLGGIRELVVGTGGAELRGFTHSPANSEFRLSGTYGVLRLTLHPVNYDWEFLPTSGPVSDSGSTICR